jgi:hypothetical protein
MVTMIIKSDDNDDTKFLLSGINKDTGYFQL